MNKKIMYIPRPEDLVVEYDPWVTTSDGMTFKRVGIRVSDVEDAEYISLTLERWLNEGKIKLAHYLTKQEQFLLGL